MIYRPGNEPDNIEEYDEKTTLNGSYGFVNQTDFMKLLLTGKL